jgi:membrane-associated protease RseP (regulator of RpoE activity)
MCRPLLLPALVALCLNLAQNCTAAEPEAAPPRDVLNLIDQLNSPDFSRREAAVESLAECGAAAIDPLVSAAQSSSLEIVSRSVGLLERMLGNEQSEVIDAADEALSALAQSAHPHASTLASAVLVRHAEVREQRAVARITELGGQIQFGTPLDQWGRQILSENAAGEPRLRPRKILLGQDWKGGVDGLAHLRKLAHLSDLHLYIEKGSGVPLAEAQLLAGILPGLIVNHRGPFLGVGTMTDGRTDCIINDVIADGPAEKAGLRKMDRVLALNDQPIAHFHELVDTLKEHAAGETVTITVQRSNPVTAETEVLKLPVQLEPWHLAPVADESREFFEQRMIIPPPQFPQRQPTAPPPGEIR